MLLCEMLRESARTFLHCTFPDSMATASSNFCTWCDGIRAHGITMRCAPSSSGSMLRTLLRSIARTSARTLRGFARVASTQHSWCAF